MAKQKQKEKKKKERDRNAHAKVLKKREQLRAKKKYDRMIDKDVDSTNDKLRPYVNPEKNARKVQNAIEHNLEILKQLEEAHEAENSFRAKINTQLESEGAVTLSDKLALIGKKVNEMADDNAQIENYVDNFKE